MLADMQTCLLRPDSLLLTEATEVRIRRNFRRMFVGIQMAAYIPVPSGASAADGGYRSPDSEEFLEGVCFAG
jgi:hypothetical protein